MIPPFPCCLSLLGTFQRWMGLLLVALLVTAGNGCSLTHGINTPLPKVLPPGASLDQIVDVLNRNAGSVQTLTSNRAKISVSGYPSIDASLVYQRERMIRLRGNAAFTGPEVDIGSNPQLFWFWVRRNTPPALYFARHDQFQSTGGRKVLPVEPDWLIKALGLVMFDASERHTGPFPVHGGMVEIRSVQVGVPDPVERRTLIDDTRCIILEQHVYDMRGTLLASAKLSDHYRTAAGTVLPRKVEIIMPAPTNVSLTLRLPDLMVNQPILGAETVFALPSYPGYENVDLADPRLMQPNPGGPIAPAGPYQPGAPFQPGTPGMQGAPVQGPVMLPTVTPQMGAMPSAVPQMGAVPPPVFRQ